MGKKASKPRAKGTAKSTKKAPSKKRASGESKRLDGGPMTPAAAAAWMARHTPGVDPAELGAKIAAALEAGAPHDKGKVDPIQLAAWFLARKADADGR